MHDSPFCRRGHDFSLNQLRHMLRAGWARSAVADSGEAAEAALPSAGFGPEAAADVARAIDALSHDCWKTHACARSRLPHSTHSLVRSWMLLSWYGAAKRSSDSPSMAASSCVMSRSSCSTLVASMSKSSVTRRDGFISGVAALTSLGLSDRDSMLGTLLQLRLIFLDHLDSFYSDLKVPL